MNRHLTTDELIDCVYGLNEDAHLSAHLEECRECAARMEAAGRRRRAAAQAAPVSSEFLAAQRRAIYARIDQPAARRLHWLPALAAAAALAVVALVYKAPAPQPSHPDSALSDAQLFSEVYSMEQSTEPAAAAPIHQLFEDSGQ
jgi:anti-sigma factor RsiW